ncbi:MAG: AAA family ATPase [Bacteroidales bacterium]|nr:AAA family ATPase [Bacteroidales bacterium]
MIIIGITGTIGAGKGTAVEYLVEKKGFVHHSVRAYLLEEILRRNWPQNRDSMFNLANELRTLHGSSYVTDQLYFRALESNQNCVIESIRTPGEIASLKEKANFFLFAIDADPKIRYSRILARQSETDQISFKTFQENEAREMVSTDPNKQNLQVCKQLADFVITNNATKEDLFRKVEKIFLKITS